MEIVLVQFDLVRVLTVTSAQLLRILVQIIVKHAHVQPAQVYLLLQHFIRNDRSNFVQLEVTLLGLLYRLIFIGLKLLKVFCGILDVLLTVSPSHFIYQTTEVFDMLGSRAHRNVA